MSEKTYHHGDLKNALIQAGIEILAEEGVGGLSLRKAARRAGVSHGAPYAHFADKQTLIAAIASDGHQKINDRLEGVLAAHPDDPLRQFTGAVWAYMQFGLESPAHYKVTFSGAIENEHIHPDFMEYSQRNMRLLKTIVERCRAAGIFNSAEMETELQAFSVWGLIHGMVSLMIQGQLPGNLLRRVQPEDIVIATLQQMVRVPVDKSMLR